MFIYFILQNNFLRVFLLFYKKDPSIPHHDYSPSKQFDEHSIVLRM
ncbi:hypothetical protein DJ66_1085 [Candidatus Liberibacter solanacearum]|uniref:Uncharacterized protein n=1 Tax=Candidatus Liberibacter solanacearum TaxID=556287 RepID=A0A0F4VM47_9HYPH|nr:hypothetical protein DJ66_1085 [Candidatus Liberibacter solanacearum]